MNNNIKCASLSRFHLHNEAIGFGGINQGERLGEDRFQESELFTQIKCLKQCQVYSKHSNILLNKKWIVEHLLYAKQDGGDTGRKAYTLSLLLDPSY